MGRRATVTTLMAALVIAASGCLGPASVVAPVKKVGPPLTYVAIGGEESLSAVGGGLSGSTTGTGGFVQPFYEHALGINTTFYDFAEPGATVAVALSDQAPKAVVLRPNVVTVWLSTSDLLAGTPAATYGDELARLLGKLRRQGRTTVLVANTPPVNRLGFYESCEEAPELCGSVLTYLPPPGTVAAEIDGYDAAAANAAAQTGAEVVDVHGAMTRALARPGEPALMNVAGYGLELTASGGAIVAGAFARALEGARAAARRAGRRAA
jgi:GDSL-like Lipase/Acylhydrolase family